MSLEAELLTAMAEAGEPLFGMRFEGYWVDSGRPESYLEAHRLVLANEPYQKPVDESADAKRSRFGGYALGPGARLGPRSVVERSVLLNDAVLESEASVADSILGARARIGAGAHLERCTVADDFVVPEGSRIIGERLGMPVEEALVPRPSRRR
jgi:mannose-1-phosphate guanylyltransferase